MRMMVGKSIYNRGVGVGVEEERENRMVEIR